MESLNKITLKRIIGDLKKFKAANPDNIDIYYDDKKPLEVNFLFIGAEDTPYKGGHYIGKIVHSPEYPVKAPDYYMMTPSGRFEICKKICLTNSSYHQESWAPAAWNLVSLLNGFLSVWNSESGTDTIGIGHLNTADSVKEKNAKLSIEYNKKNYSELYDKFEKIKV